MLQFFIGFIIGGLFVFVLMALLAASSIERRDEE